MILEPLKDGHAHAVGADWPSDQTILILNWRELQVLNRALNAIEAEGAVPLRDAGKFNNLRARIGHAAHIAEAAAREDGAKDEGLRL